MLKKRAFSFGVARRDGVVIAEAMECQPFKPFDEDELTFIINQLRQYPTVIDARFNDDGKIVVCLNTRNGWVVPVVARINGRLKSFQDMYAYIQQLGATARLSQIEHELELEVA